MIYTKARRFLVVFSILFALFIFPPLITPAFAYTLPAVKTTYSKSDWFNKSAVTVEDKNPTFTTLYTLNSKFLRYVRNESETLTVKNLNLNIPENATIKGITVNMVKRVDRFLDGQREYPIVDKSVKLTIGGSISGEDKANETPYSNTSYETFAYGSDTDTWGLTLTPADVNSPDFGVTYSVKRSELGHIPQIMLVDQIRVEVNYEIIPAEAVLVYESPFLPGESSSFQSGDVWNYFHNIAFDVPENLNVTKVVLTSENTGTPYAISSISITDGINWGTVTETLSFTGTNYHYFNNLSFNTSNPLRQIRVMMTLYAPIDMSFTTFKISLFGTVNP